MRISDQLDENTHGAVIKRPATFPTTARKSNRTSKNKTPLQPHHNNRKRTLSLPTPSTKKHHRHTGCGIKFELAKQRPF